ncbi:MAG TPA: hypothetical protein VK610_10635, partial [Rhodothermales bacterium]|nr:hypothetical protein [Rhodothermales bacterium]
ACFSRSLRLPLEAAGRHIGRRDSVEAIGALYEFQFRLEEVYSHPEPDVGELTEQGFGFLWLTVQYLLDRLHHLY